MYSFYYQSTFHIIPLLIPYKKTLTIIANATKTEFDRMCRSGVMINPPGQMLWRIIFSSRLDNELLIQSLLFDWLKLMAKSTK